jgi:hypothetical protein
MIDLSIPQNHVFFTPEFIKLDSRYIFVDSTYKSNREGYELFVFILLYEGEGFPAVYLFLKKLGYSTKGSNTKIVNILVKFI